MLRARRSIRAYLHAAENRAASQAQSAQPGLFRSLSRLGPHHSRQRAALVPAARNLDRCWKHGHISLFERRNRAVFLTDAGAKLLNSTHLAFRQISECCAELRSDTPAPLVVSCEPTLTQRWLIPRLPLFAEEHPDIVIHVLAAGGAVNFEKNHVDVAIRRSDFNWPPDVFEETIVEERVGPVCAPSLVTNGTIEELLSLPRIHSATRSDAWDRWAADHATLLNVPPSRTFEHFYLTLEAATAGLGVAIASELMVIDAIRIRRLTAPLAFKQRIQIRNVVSLFSCSR